MIYGNFTKWVTQSGHPDDDNYGGHDVGDGDDDLLLALGVLLLQLFQHVDLELGGLPVLVHVLDDLQGEHLVSAHGNKHQKLFET